MNIDNSYIWKQVLVKQLLTDKSFEVHVNGNSMFPIIKNGDIIKVVVSRDQEYQIGDILVFPYKKEGFLVHRLLKIKDGRYFCKGDNSLRLEDFESQDVLGIVNVPNDLHRTTEFVEFSLLISKIHRKCGYNSSLTRSQKEYIEYENRYLKQRGLEGGCDES